MLQDHDVELLSYEDEDPFGDAVAPPAVVHVTAGGATDPRAAVADPYFGGDEDAAVGVVRPAVVAEVAADATACNARMVQVFIPLAFFADHHR